MAASPYKSRKPLTRYGKKGFSRMSDAAKGLIRPALSKRGFAETRLIVEWDAVVGAANAALCRPIRLSYAAKEGIGGTLTLGVLGVNALQIQHLEPQLIERVNAHYGYRAISRIRIAQLGPEAFARARQTAETPQLRPEEVREVRQTVEPVQDESLRTALEKLGRNIATKRAKAAQTTDKQVP